MDKDTRVAEASEKRIDSNKTNLAQLVRDDFRGLIAIFDHQLANAAGGDPETLDTIREARAAAERGVDLTEKLLKLLQTAD